MSGEYIIYCDESIERGRHFSDFYGGALVRSEHIDEVRDILSQRMAELNLGAEVKWNKISEDYRNKYIDLIDTFFDLVQDDKIKIRIMFTQNIIVARGLEKRHYEDKFFILYYMFLKFGFGLEHSLRLRVD